MSQIHFHHTTCPRLCLQLVVYEYNFVVQPCAILVYVILGTLPTNIETHVTAYVCNYLFHAYIFMFISLVYIYPFDLRHVPNLKSSPNMLPVIALFLRLSSDSLLEPAEVSWFSMNWMRMASTWHNFQMGKACAYIPGEIFR
jgi:hypothetical protein